VTSPRHLVALVGPTAAGKTAAAIAVAEHLPVEIVSADSRQVRSGMVVGTAAPTKAELEAVPHHIVGVVAPDAPWSIVDWLERARAVIELIWERDHIPLVVGGTGQYVWALLEGWEVPAVPPNLELRDELERRAKERGWKSLHEHLARLDPASAERIEPRNVRRVIRALEIIDATGGPVPPLTPRDPGFTWSVVGMQWDRETLYARADERVTAMFRGGLLGETRSLVAKYGRDFEALRSIGYPEALGVIDGEWSEAQGIEKARLATHRFIRHQNNWFAPDDARIQWVDGRRLETVVDAVVRAARPPVGSRDDG
jgi:tRNA dimethylallyltransferase